MQQGCQFPELLFTIYGHRMFNTFVHEPQRSNNPYICVLKWV